MLTFPFPLSRATPLGRSRYQTSEFPTTSEFPNELPTHDALSATHTLSQTLSVSHSHTHSHSLSGTHVERIAIGCSLSHTLSLTHKRSHTHSLFYTQSEPAGVFTLSLSLSQTRLHTLSRTHIVNREAYSLFKAREYRKAFALYLRAANAGTLHPNPYTLHPTHSTLHPKPSMQGLVLRVPCISARQTQAP